MEDPVQPSRSTDAAQQTEDDNQEIAGELGENMISSEQHATEENVHSEGMQTIDQQLETDTDTNLDTPGDQNTSDEVDQTEDKPPDLGLSASEEKHEPEAESAPAEDVIDPNVSTTEEESTDQVAPVLSADLPGTEQAPETMQEDITEASDTMKDADTEVSQKENNLQQPSQENDTNEKKTSSEEASTDQVAPELRADLPGTEQAPETMQKDSIETSDTMKDADTEVSQKEDNVQQPSQENDKNEKKTSSDVSSSTATVKVMLVPDGQVVTIAFSIGKSVGDLKNYFASQMKIPETVLQIMFEGRMVEDHETFMDLGITPHGTIQLEMHSLDPENYPIKTMTFQHGYSMPDVINVRVQTGDNIYQEIAVEIERLNYHKPYLGGYRHKVTGVVFYHAGTQTVPKKRPDKGVEVFCRDTQTVFVKNKIQQSRNTMSTQMTKTGCYVSNETDKLVQPQKYVTADEYHARRHKAVIVIQTYFRRFHAKKVVEQLKEEKRLRLEWEAREELRKKAEKEERIRKEYEHRMNPKTKEDFELLYHALELWRKEEVERINQQYTGPERKAALCGLLEQETQLISSIGRHKIDAGEENQQKAIQSLLNKCCDPKKWKAFDGKTTEMDTQFTIRARELRDIYNSINAKYFTHDERLDALLTLKHTVKEHNCKLTQEIVELIDREADLLMRGVRDGNLEGLRKRISTLFLQYIKTPTFNPEIARLLKVPQDSSVLRKNIYFCPSCKSYLPSTEFSLSANARSIGRCRKCSKLDNEARQREEFSKYRLLMKQLKKSEIEYGDDSKIAFLLQQEDLQYLVENIWASQSALSACDDLYDLVIVRWDKYYEWSPWNCILLTKDEAAAHIKLGNAEQAYGIVFIRKIKHRHTLAKNYFSQIPEMAPFLHREKSDQMSAANDLVISKPIAAASQS